MCRIVQYVGILRCRIVQVPLYLQSSPLSICNQNMKLRKLSCPERAHLLTITICLSLLRFNRCSCSYRLTHAYHRSRSWLCQSNHLGEYPGPGQFYLCTPPWHLRIYRNIVCFWTIHCNKNSQIPSINKTMASFIWNTEVIWYILRNICLVSSNIIIQTWNALLEKYPGVTSGTLKVKRLKNILE